MQYSRIVPNYELPPDLGKTEILRVVVRENMTMGVNLFALCPFCYGINDVLF